MLAEKYNLWSREGGPFDIIAITAAIISSLAASPLFTRKQQTTAPLRWRASLRSWARRWSQTPRSRVSSSGPWPSLWRARRRLGTRAFAS